MVDRSMKFQKYCVFVLVSDVHITEFCCRRPGEASKKINLAKSYLVMREMGDYAYRIKQNQIKMHQILKQEIYFSNQS